MAGQDLPHRVLNRLSLLEVEPEQLVETASIRRLQSCDFDRVESASRLSWTGAVITAPSPLYP